MAFYVPSVELCTHYDKFSLAIHDVINHPCPVSTLPTELLQEIFAFSMTKRPRLGLAVGIPPEELEPTGFQATALILTWVCSQWRQIALSMPELWGTMTIYTPKKYSVNFVKVYLSRSGDSAPLDLSLSQSSVTNHRSYHFPELFPEHQVTVEILKIWVSQAHRWRKINLRLEITSPLHELPDIPPDALSAVEEANLQFSKTPGHSSNVIKGLWGDILRSPVLKTAFWHNLKRILPPAPFSHLEEFKLFFATADQLSSILPSCGRLRRLHVGSSCQSAVHGSVASDVAIVLPCLEYLRLFIQEGMVATLDRLTTPLLQELCVHDSSQVPFADEHLLERFLQRSKCTIQTMQLWDRQSREKAPIITSLFNASGYLQNLESLLIDSLHFPDKVASLFETQIAGSTLLVPLPSLLNLEIHSVRSPQDGIISSMVESRSAAGLPLRIFKCRVQCGPLSVSTYPKDKALFQSLMADGLQLYWTSWEV